MAPRLQGTLFPDGRLELALWGAGDLGRIRFAPPAGAFVHAPNRLTWPGGGLFVAQSVPAVLLQGIRPLRVTPARKAAAWASPAPAHEEHEGERRIIQLPWGCLALETRPDGLVVAAGDDRAQAQRGLALSAAAIAAEADAYAAACDRLPDADPLLRSLVVQGVHTARANVRRAADGAFAGLSAGLAYSAPARTYFRDGYWTLQLLLQLDPALGAAQIDLLAACIHENGEAPSGGIVSGPAQSRAWEQRRLASPTLSAVHTCAGDWWSDHFDSPLFFILALGDHAAASGDDSLARRHWDLVAAVLGRYRAFAAGGPLPLKPRNDRDWADNAFREGLVAYDLGLWVGALDVVARLGAGIDASLAGEAGVLAAEARAAIDERLWLGRWHADYRTGAFTEGHLALDSLTLLRFDAVSGERAGAVLQAARDLLETRHNTVQPYGDWGVMCAWPPFARRADLRAKTAFPYRYHNGADWPWLSGLYAGERLRRGLAGWRYPLTRWWESALANGWVAPVEYFSPPYGRGSLLQAWSSLPAAVALAHRDAVLKGDAEASRRGAR